MADERYLVAAASSDGIVDDKLQENASVLSDCEYLLVSKVGDGARAVLESKGITCYEIPGFISESIDKMQRYEKVKNLFS